MRFTGDFCDATLPTHREAVSFITSHAEGDHAQLWSGEGRQGIRAHFRPEAGKCRFRVIYNLLGWMVEINGCMLRMWFISLFQ